MPEKNTALLLDPQEAYTYLDTAYDYAKDAHAYSFTQHLLNLLSNNKVSFFYSRVDSTNDKTGYFAAAVYSLTATDTSLTSIADPSLNYFIRYYADRAEYVYNMYKSSGGTGPFTTIADNISNNLQDRILNEKIKGASYSILAAPYLSLINISEPTRPY